MKYLYLVIFCSSFFSSTYTQITQNEKVIKSVIGSSQPIHIIGKPLNSKYVTLSRPYNNHIQNLLKLDNGIYVYIDGTGMLYKLSDTFKSQFTRIDSTKFWGYNLGTFTFTYKSDIYNLGGIGIWRSNGHLRKYNFLAHEWDIVPLNLELPLVFSYSEGMISYDEANGRIYCGYYYSMNDGIKSEIKDGKYEYKVMQLDLKTKVWSYLGELNSDLIEGIRKEVNVAITPMGLLTAGNSKISLWDFKENKHYELNDNKEYYQTIRRGIDSTLIYNKDQNLIISRGSNLDSFKLGLSDFSQKGPIYSPSISTIIKPYLNAIYLLIFALFIAIGYLLLKRYKCLVISNYEEKLKAEKKGSERGVLLFKDQELLLLNLLIANSKKGIKTTIEEINHVLGLDSRSIEIQKSQRHKVITSINETYNAKTDRKLIQSDKLDIDRRSYVYFIAEEEIKTLLNVWDAGTKVRE